MEREYGPHFREMRMNKKIRINSLADKVVSKGMISQFERNNSNISVSRFLHLLEKIKVRPSEFFLRNEQQIDNFESLVAISTRLALEKDVEKLRELLLREVEKNEYSQLNSYMLEAMISGMTGESFEPSKLESLSDYLLGCEYWGFYELVLYGNMMATMPVDMIIAFSKALPKRMRLLKQADRLFEITNNILLKTLLICIREDRKADGYFFVNVIGNLELAEKMLFERALFKFYQGLFNVKFRIEHDLGQKQIQQSLTALVCLDANRVHRKLSQEFELIMGYSL